MEFQLLMFSRHPFMLLVSSVGSQSRVDTNKQWRTASRFS